MAATYEFDGVTPVVHPTAFVHPQAVLIGDVVIGAHCFVGPFASLRADFGQIRLEQGANVQDGCVLHCFPGGQTVVGPNGHVGHAAVLHGCVLEPDVLVGMNAVVMDRVRVGARAFVGAGSFVRADFVVPPATLVAGSPAVVVRDLTDSEMSWKDNGTKVYQDLARRCLETLLAAEPEVVERPDRRTMLDPRSEPVVHVTLREHRALQT